MRTLKGSLVVLLLFIRIVFLSTDLVWGDITGTSSAIVLDKNANEVTNKKQTEHDDNKSWKSDKKGKGRDKDKGKDKGKDKDKDKDKDKCNDDVDRDGDGYSSKYDCDDNNSSINPAAREICDGVDNNCDGQIDEGLKTTFYEDTDGDGCGNPHVAIEACSQPLGYVANNTDCDDTNATVNPGATEIKKNGLDDDCNPSTPDDDARAKLPTDPGEEGKKTLLGIDADGDGVRDDIQRYIYFTYSEDRKLRLGLTHYAMEFHGVLKDANDREACYEHANKMARHGECLWYLKGRDSFDIIDQLLAEILNTRERSIAYITYSDNLGGRVISGAPLKEWKGSCSFDVDAVGDDQ